MNEEQTIQWPKDTKGEIGISQSTKNTQYNGQKIPKGKSESVNRRRTDNAMAKRYQMVIRINKSIKNRKYNGQKIPKVQAESVNRRRTDNTMAKRYQRGNPNQ